MQPLKITTKPAQMSADEEPPALKPPTQVYLVYREWAQVELFPHLSHATPEILETGENRRENFAAVKSGFSLNKSRHTQNCTASVGVTAMVKVCCS